MTFEKRIEPAKYVIDIMNCRPEDITKEDEHAFLSALGDAIVARADTWEMDMGGRAWKTRHGWAISLGHEKATP